MTNQKKKAMALLNKADTLLEFFKKDGDLVSVEMMEDICANLELRYDEATQEQMQAMRGKC